MPEPVFMPPVKDETQKKKRGKAGAPEKIVGEKGWGRFTPMEDAR